MLDSVGKKKLTPEFRVVLLQRGFNHYFRFIPEPGVSPVVPLLYSVTMCSTILTSFSTVRSQMWHARLFAVSIL